MVSGYPAIIGWIIVALCNIVFIYQDHQLFINFLYFWWPSWIYIFRMTTKWYNNMIIGFPTLENMDLDIKIIHILQLDFQEVMDFG